MSPLNVSTHICTAAPKLGLSGSGRWLQAASPRGFQIPTTWYQMRNKMVDPQNSQYINSVKNLFQQYKGLYNTKNTSCKASSPNLFTNLVQAGGYRLLHHVDSRFHPDGTRCAINSKNQNAWWIFREQYPPGLSTFWLSTPPPYEQKDRNSENITFASYLACAR